MARFELFLVWESNCRGIVNDIQLLPEKILKDIKLRIFLRKDTPVESRPPNVEWIELYHSFTTAPYASDTTLVVFLTKYFKDLSFFSEENGDTESSCDPVQFYFVVDSESERKFEELIAILNIDCKSKVQMKQVNGEEGNIPAILGLNYCHECKEVFHDEHTLNKHNMTFHNFFCTNRDCPRSKKRFYNQEDLVEHTAKQTTCPLCHDNSPTFCANDAKLLHMRIVHRQDVTPQKSTDHTNCDFCPKKHFSSPEQKESHMKNTHKKCNCGCGVYFKSREHYLEHFYTVYPLACFENRKCPYRFQTILYQAEHHRNAHNSDHPYYCAVCFKQSDEQRVTGRVAFKDETTLKHHGKLMKHTSQDMFFVQETSSKAMAKSSAINYC